MLQPMQGHYGKILKVNFAVAVYVAGDDGFTGWFAEVRLTRLGCSAIGAHIDDAAVRERLEADWAKRVAGVNTGTRHLVYRPSSLACVPSACPGFQVVVSIYPEIVVGVFGRAIRVPESGQSKTGVNIRVARSPIQLAAFFEEYCFGASLNVAIADGNFCRGWVVAGRLVVSQGDLRSIRSGVTPKDAVSDLWVAVFVAEYCATLAGCVVSGERTISQSGAAFEGTDGAAVLDRCSVGDENTVPDNR